jgi:tight adherence protein C
MALTFGIAVVFVSVGLAAGTLCHAVLMRHAPARRRLRELTATYAAAEAGSARSATPPLRVEPHPLAKRLAALLPRSSGRMAEIRQRLALAGYRANSAPVVFTAVQVACAGVVATVLFLLGGLEHLAWPSLGAIAGALIPELWLMQRRNAYSHAIGDALPDGLDLLVICLEAGCSLDHAIVKSSDELRLSRRELADELALITHEIRAGRSRADAFRQFGARSSLEEIQSLVSILVQTDRYGTSVTQALRTHADLCRTRRRQRAEERAAKASVKLVFPLVFCLFPAFYLIALGPTMIHFFRALMKVTFGD